MQRKSVGGCREGQRAAFMAFEEDQASRTAGAFSSRSLRSFELLGVPKEHLVRISVPFRGLSVVEPVTRRVGS